MSLCSNKILIKWKLLLKSRDLLGDPFLLNLPDILLNIDDLQGLFKFVLGKVSIKDLTDIMIDKIGVNLSIPDINEIKLHVDFSMDFSNFMILFGVSTGISYFSTQRCTYRISTAHARTPTRTHLTAFAHEHMIRSAHVCYVPSTYGITRYVHDMCTTLQACKPPQ